MLHKKRVLYLLLVSAAVTFNVLPLSACRGVQQEKNGKTIEDTYQIVTMIYTDEGIRITYPQISQYPDADRQRIINEILRTEALKILDQYTDVQDRDEQGSIERNRNGQSPNELGGGGLSCNEQSSNDRSGNERGSDSQVRNEQNNDNQSSTYIPLTVVADAAVMLKSPMLISVRYTGYANASGAAHPSDIFFTTNIDIRNAKRIRLKDFAAIDEGFIGLFRKGEYVAGEGEMTTELMDAIMDYVSRLDDKTLIDRFKKADSLDLTESEYPSDTFSYFTKDALGISISVPHVYGDHAEFELKYRDIIKYIKDPSLIEN